MIFSWIQVHSRGTHHHCPTCWYRISCMYICIHCLTKWGNVRYCALFPYLKYKLCVCALMDLYILVFKFNKLNFLTSPIIGCVSNLKPYIKNCTFRKMNDICAYKQAITYGIPLKLISLSAFRKIPGTILASLTVSFMNCKSSRTFKWDMYT